MSKITDVYNALKTRIETVLPNNTRMTNPYKPEENMEPILDRAYGIQIGSMINTERRLSCTASIQRTFVVVLTRKYFALELDREQKQIAELQLVEDQFLLIKDFEGEPTLGDSDAVTRSKVASDAGIEFVFNEKDNFFKLEMDVEIEYFEDLTT